MRARKPVDAIHRRDVRQRDDWPDARHRHQTASRGIRGRQARELRVDIVDLIVQRSEQFQQRLDFFFQFSR